MSGDTRGHLRRLDHVWVARPLYFVTTCTAQRRRILDNRVVVEILREEWFGWKARRGWEVGPYVVMPDHVHFFAMPIEPLAGLQSAMQAWKQWTAKRMIAVQAVSSPIWQGGFFDHVIRSRASLRDKWSYVRENPVRAGLVAESSEWPYAGSVDFE